MHQYSADVITRFLRHDERLILSEEQEMPLVIEAKERKDINFLQQFIHQHSTEIHNDLGQYGAILLRGFTISSDHDFEKTVLSLQGFKGISDAFMSEEGRIQVEDLKYVLHTNAVYKTGGTLYLGGFHSENYYSTDVPSTICFCCLQPSVQGGETGLINTEKLYQNLDPALQNRLEKKTYFVTKWLLSEVAERYHISIAHIEKIAQRFQIPLLGERENRFILMYKPSVFVDPESQKKALQINFFELLPLNMELRKCFEKDYQGPDWFWHRFIWKLPKSLMKTLELIYIACASFFYSPKAATQIWLNKLKTAKAARKIKIPLEKVGVCFNKDDIKKLAEQMRQYYCSCLWQKGDILLVDNRKVVHAGMPGKGPRLIRAMIGNPLEIPYSASAPGMITCRNSPHQTVGADMTTE